MEKLRQLLQAHGFTSEEQTQILGLFQEKRFSKGDLFVQEGGMSQYLGFIEKGVFQYYCNLDGDEITTYLTGENSFVVSLVSFLRRQPATENIRAITDSVVWELHQTQFEKLKKDIVRFYSFYVGMLEYQIVCIDESRHAFITQNADERYEKLIEKDPHLLQQVPLQYLASMLGVTPRHLSRIRKSTV